MLTSRIPPSYELNKINIFLRKACLNGQLYSNFEDYVASILFQMPLTERLNFFTLQVYLPSVDNINSQERQSSERSSNRRISNISAGNMRNNTINEEQVL